MKNPRFRGQTAACESTTACRTEAPNASPFVPKLSATCFSADARCPAAAVRCFLEASLCAERLTSTCASVACVAGTFACSRRSRTRASQVASWAHWTCRPKDYRWLGPAIPTMTGTPPPGKTKTSNPQAPHKTRRPGPLRALDLLSSVHAFQGVAHVVPNDDLRHGLAQVRVVGGYVAGGVVRGK